MKPDIEASPDRNEMLGIMEPLLIPESCPYQSELQDLAFDLAKRSAALKAALPPNLVAALADLVRSMNCYYSNLIEGHDTHPVDIERALNNDYSSDAKKRNLQIEAKAHIHVQQWIDAGGIDTVRPTEIDAIKAIHQKFCDHLPENLLMIEDPDTKAQTRMEPGQFRSRDVKVGGHVAVSPGAVPRFIDRYSEAYRRLGKSASVIATAAAHHRLLWIHPFLDGNGRVTRLMSHAMLAQSLETGAIWSIARGLARNVQEYKGHLAACDLGRRNDLDGRGTLSQEALLAFTRFFLRTCIDQIKFMESLMQPEELRARILIWTEEKIRLDLMPQKAGRVLEALLYRGELPRSEVADLVDTGDRQARRFIASLVELGVVQSQSTRAPLKLAFPAKLVSRWMPGLFPDKPAE